MVSYCVVPGCKTNRTKKDKLPMFYVPKDAGRREEWRKIIGVEKLVASHRVCQKHFPGEKILGYTEHSDGKGKILCRIPRAYPQLAKDAVPKLFLNGKASKITNMDDAEEYFVIVCSDSEDLDISENVYSNETIVNNSAEDNSENAKPNQMNNSDANYEIIAKNIFQVFCEQLYMEKLPEDWCLHVCLRKGYTVLLEVDVNQFDNGLPNTVVKKSISINRKFQATYMVLGKVVILSKFPTKIENPTYVKIIVQRFSNLFICPGIPHLRDVDLVQNKLSYKDPMGVLRHNECDLITNTRRCFRCARTSKTISQKKRRIRQRFFQLANPVLTDCDSTRLQSTWKKKIHAQRAAIEKTKATIDNLKLKIDKITADQSTVDVADLLKSCKEKNISDLQQSLLQEIIGAACCKSLKDYKEWAILCNVLYHQSPQTYKHLQEIQLLPLPCYSTIQQYLSFVDSFKRT